VDRETVISSFYNFPNPVEGPRDIVFRFVHNLSPPFTAELKIFNIEGQLIYETNSKLNSLHSGDLQWDCRDSFNNSLPSGSYLCQLKLISDKEFQELKRLYLII